MLNIVVRLALAVVVASPFVASAREALAADATAVRYRLVNARTLHLDDEAAARQYEQTFRQLGCEVQLQTHDDHFDLAYRCNQWRQVQFADHTSAHKWQDWFSALGFEVQHQH